jgi:Tol biopolymer transport system component
MKVGLALLLVTVGCAVCAAAMSATEPPYRAAIYSVRDDGSARRLIAQPEPPVADLIRSPGGRSILFTREIDGDFALFAAETSGANAVRLSPPGLSVTLDRTAVSPDGRTVAFSSFVACGWRCTLYALHVVNRDGSGRRRVAEHATWPSWAPDSRRFAYTSQGEIHVHDIATQETTLVAPGLADRPVWAPRGERIAYTWHRGHSHACFVNADGSRRRCTRGRSLTTLVWSRNGSRVAIRQATPRRLGFVDANARRIRYLGYHGRDARPAAWSPDGKRLAFWLGSHGTDSSRVDVLRLAAPRRAEQVIGEGDAYLHDLRWRGRSITYVAAWREQP